MQSVLSQRLRSLLEAAQVPSQRALCQQAGVSRWQLRQLTSGQLPQLRLETLLKLSRALGRSPEELIALFSSPEAEVTPQPQANPWQQEYQRLQAQLAAQEQQLLQAFRQASLQTLESLLLQLPTARYAAQQHPDIPASRLLPLLRPLDQLLMEWDVAAIAPVGAELPYDPQLHQLMEGDAAPGDRVRVRYTGYQWGDRLLYRAKVSPV